MSFIKNNSSQFNSHGDPEKLLGTIRKIRPYRHAYIRISNPAPATLIYNYSNNINEFGGDLIANLVYDGAGIYAIDVNTSYFKNIDNVIQETDIIHSEAANLPILSSIFIDDLKTRIHINIFDFLTASTIDIEGEILLIIREFYD